MASTSELKKVKLNITNIKSVLVDGKKAVDEKQKERQDFLTKLEEERKQRREEKAFEKPIDPNKKKPDLKSPVKSSMGLMDRIFTFVGAIVGGMIVKALPEIIDTFKKVFEKVKPFFDGLVEFLSPVFASIGKFFESKDSYESEKEKVNENLDAAKLEGKNIDGQVGELNKANDEIIDENKSLAETSKLLGKEGEELSKDREEKDDNMDEEQKDEITEDTNETKDETKVESNEMVSAEGLTTPATEVVQTVDGKEKVVTDMDESLKIQNDAREIYKNALDNNVPKFSPDLVGKEIKLDLPPSRSDYPRGKDGLKRFKIDFRTYVIEKKKREKNLIKPSENNKNGLNALNTTEGLTSVNGSGSNTIIVQRQIVEVPIKVPVKV